jgi:type III secretion system low calcium response chaperone LcrH/SycD
MSHHIDNQNNDEQILQKVMDEISLQKKQGISQETLDGLYLCAWNLYQQYKLDEAETLFRFLCLLNVGHKDYLTGLATVYQLKKKYRRAIELYNAAWHLDIDDLRPQLQTGYCHLLMKNNDKACTCFKKVSSSSNDPQLKLIAQNYLNALNLQNS